MGIIGAQTGPDSRAPGDRVPAPTSRGTSVDSVRVAAVRHARQIIQEDAPSVVCRNYFLLSFFFFFSLSLSNVYGWSRQEDVGGLDVAPRDKTLSLSRGCATRRTSTADLRPSCLHGRLGTRRLPDSGSNKAEGIGEWRRKEEGFGKK